MLSILHLSRCTLRSAPSKLLAASSCNSRQASRQLITYTQHCKNNTGITRGYKLSSLIKSNGIVARFCSSSPQPKNSKAVGYWLLGCSGMVVTAVVLGMAVGYMVTLYCVCYVIDIVLDTTNGRK